MHNVSLPIPYIKGVMYPSVYQQNMHDLKGENSASIINQLTIRLGQGHHIYLFDRARSGLAPLHYTAHKGACVKDSEVSILVVV